MKRKEIKITSKSHNELSSIVIAGEEKYIVETEREGSGSFFIDTKVYQKGKIISTIKTDCKNKIRESDTESKMFELMQRQHQLAIDTLKPEEMRKVEKLEKIQQIKTPSDYLEDLKFLLRRKNRKNALELMMDALEQYPDDPFILSYYGCLEAIVNRKYKYGVDTCERAIKTLKEKVPFGEEFFYPVLYLNLGRAYLAAGRKKNAIDAFNKGLTVDSENRDLLMELRRLGIRKKPAVSFLQRSNPINKYIGMILHKLKK